jgi:hypothetical protein
MRFSLAVQVRESAVHIRRHDRPRRADLGFEDAAAQGNAHIRAGSYVLEFSARDHKWLIRENNDYLLADQTVMPLKALLLWNQAGVTCMSRVVPC